MRGGRKSERLKEREIDREKEDWSGWRTAAARSGGFRGGVEWAGGRWQPDQWHWARGRRRVKEEERKKRMFRRRVIWAMGQRELGGRGGTIRTCRSLVGRPPVRKSFEGKMETKMNLQLRKFILQSNWILFSVWLYFQVVPNTHPDIKCFQIFVYRWNKRNLQDKVYREEIVETILKTLYGESLSATPAGSKSNGPSAILDASPQRTTKANKCACSVCWIITLCIVVLFIFIGVVTTVMASLFK